MAKDPYKYFRIEARELLEQLGKGVLELEREGAGPDVVPRLLRLAHTLKGAARVVKQREVADLAHALEDQLAPFRESLLALPRDGLDAMLALLDSMGARVAALSSPPNAGGTPTTNPPTEESFRTLRTDVAEMDGLLDGIAETQAWLAAVRPRLASVERAGRLASLVAEQATSPRAQDGPKTALMAEELRALIVDFGRGLGGGFDRVDRGLQQVRNAGERLRLLPAGTLFNSLERAVRDAARTLGKRVTFRGEGGDIRLDGHVLGTLQTALVQVVRNAVAHGIEPENERVAAGKPPEGSVVVEVARRGGRVVFVCRDDGRGIDLEAVRRTLERKGLPSVEARGSGPEELLRLLLEGGISTTSAVTEVSGRGIGLDVVREAISGLGGQPTVRTRAGQGTTLELLVPVSLSSLEALVVEAAGATAAIPLDAVRQTVRVPESDITAAASPSIVYERALIPFLPLAHALGVGARGGRAQRAWSAVVVSAGGGLAAVGVDRLLGTASILVRSLPPLAPAGGIVAGTSLDAEGNPRLVLDPARLVVAARQATPQAATPPPPPPILVVDDSLTTRMLEQSILESAGYSVELASSGEEALEKAARQRYGLFLVDVEMPGLDGFAVLEHMQSAPELRGVPVILVTSRSSVEDRKRGAQLGARAYVVKSEFDQVELLSRIRGLVG